MRTWTRALFTRLCGNCGDLIERGDPVLEVVITCTTAQAVVVTITKVRCQACDGPAPPDLPRLVERRVETPTTMHPIQSLARMLPLDWKARSAGREPGEEG